MTDDPIAVMRESHRKIEASVAVLIRASELASAAAPAGEQREAFEKALAFFRHSVPRHTADEEESIFPRLRQEKASDLLPVLARIESLEEEHVCAEQIQAEIEGLCDAWLQGRELTGDETARLTRLLKSLRDTYRHHIAVEEEEVFPAAASRFSAATLDSIAREMALRRGRSNEI